MSGRLEQIWTKRFHLGRMDAIPRADLRTGVGLVDNADQGGARQVAVISKERWGHGRSRAPSRTFLSLVSSCATRVEGTARQPVPPPDPR